MYISKNLIALFGFGIFLLVWESFNLVSFSVTNSIWTGCIFMVFGSAMLATATLAFMGPKSRGYLTDSFSGKQTFQPIIRNPQIMFYTVNMLSGIVAMTLVIVCLNSSTLLYFQKKVYGKSVVEFPIKDVGNPQSILLHGTSVIDFYNAKISNKNPIEYVYHTKKYCAFPVIAHTYQRKDQSGFWARCQIPRRESCQNVHLTECSDSVGAPISVGRRVGEGEEKIFREKLGNRNGILVDTHDVDMSLYGLWYYALNFLWLVPTVTALVYVTKRNNRDN